MSNIQRAIEAVRRVAAEHHAGPAQESARRPGRYDYAEIAAWVHGYRARMGVWPRGRDVQRRFGMSSAYASQLVSLIKHSGIEKPR